MTTQNPKLLWEISDHPAASTGQQALARIAERIRSLNRDDIRYRFDRAELIELVEYLIFDEPTAKEPR